METYSMQVELLFIRAKLFHVWYGFGTVHYSMSKNKRNGMHDATKVEMACTKRNLSNYSY